MKKIKNQPSDPDNVLKHPAVIRLLSFSLLCGVLLCCGFAPVNAWFAAIFMPAIIFKIWQRLPTAWVFLSGFLFGAGLYLAGTSWVFQSFYHFSQASILVSCGIIATLITYFSVFYGLLALGVRYSIKKQFSWQILLVFPSLWVLMEWCIGHLFTGCPWLLIGYTQITSPLHVFAPIVGVYGLSFITIFMSAILVILTQQSELKKYYITWLILAMLVLLSLIAKHMTWTKALPISQTISIVQPQLDPTIKWLPSTLQNIESTYQNLTAPYWKNSDLIIWPESALPVFPEDITQWLANIQEKINKDHTHLITGITTSDQQNHYFNSAMLLSPYATPQLYRKRHLLPFGEYFPFRSSLDFVYHYLNVPMSDFTQGEGNQPLLAYGSWRIATSVCFEIIFPDEIINTMKDANLLVVISDDSWFGHTLASFQHLGIAQMRALETGRYLIFSNDTGPSAIIRPDGTLEKSTEQQSIAVLTGTVSQMTGITPFMRFGSWPVIGLSIAILLLAVFCNQVYSRKEKIE
jgi:apolipoprotein N-acyltransferase